MQVLRDTAVSAQPPGAIGYSLGATDAVAALHLRAAFLEQPVDPADLAKAKGGAGQTFPIRAADFMPAYQGAALGERLRKLENAWIASAFTLTKSKLMRL